MMVYVVTAGYDYEESHVVGVYSSYFLAQQCVDSMKSDPKIYYDNYDIEEFDVDN